MKLLGPLKSMNNMKKSNLDSFLVGIEDLTVNYPSYKMIDIKKINKVKEVFIVLNKNYHNHELDYLKEALISLEEIGIKKVLFYDMAVIGIVKELGLKLELIWAQEHFTTNYQTINHFINNGCSGAFISSEITINEIEGIIKNVKDKTLIVNLFGYMPIFASERNLISNYKKEFNLTTNSKVNYLKKDGLTYPIIDNKYGTFVYSSYILNGIKEYKKVNNSYVFLNNFLISDKLYDEVVLMFKSVNEDNKDEYFNKINNMFEGNTKTGFLYLETVFKVKK